MESGIEMAMITVERQLPRNSKIIKLVRIAAIAPSKATPLTAARTNTDWSLIGTASRLSGKVDFISASLALAPDTMSNVEVAPFFRIDISTDLEPSTCTILFCGG